MTKGSKTLPYEDLSGMFEQIKKAINSNNKRKYIYAYWDKLDAFNHKYGVGYKESEKHFKEIEKNLKKFINDITNTDTALIIVSDHGFVNTPFEKIIKLEDNPKMKECFTLPLCGERRTAFCYVHPLKAKQFETYVMKNLDRYCELYKSQDLINKNFFGLFEANLNLFDRVGDYILILKENYIIRDEITEKEKRFSIGHHGGISKEEMLVPLIFIKK
ncbi:MAG: alkaline phosphatase family protein [Nanoarchaeota archaeon]